MKTQKYLITIEMPDGDMISPSWIQELIQADCDVEDKGRQKVLVEEIKPEVDLEKFTEKMDDWKARFSRPDDIPIKATMAFTARMFYMYPKVAREWYESLPKATQD